MEEKKQEQLNLSKIDDFQPDVPIGVCGIINIPKFKINMSFSSGNHWEYSISEWICFTYLSLIFRRILRINYRTAIWDQVGYKLSNIDGIEPTFYFPEALSHKGDLGKNEWLEQLIIRNIIDKSNIELRKSKTIFQEQIYSIVDSIVDEPGDFNSPGKVIAKKLIKRIDSEYWSFQEDKKFFNLFEYTEVKIEKNDQKMFHQQLKLLKSELFKCRKDKVFENFYGILNKTIIKAIQARQDRSD